MDILLLLVSWCFMEEMGVLDEAIKLFIFKNQEALYHKVFLLLHFWHVWINLNPVQKQNELWLMRGIEAVVIKKVYIKFRQLGSSESLDMYKKSRSTLKREIWRAKRVYEYLAW